MTYAGKCFVVHVEKVNHELKGMDDKHTSMCESMELKELKERFADIFADPIALSPLMGVFYHRIALQKDASPINIRPYKYPLKHKEVIEQLVKEMVDMGIV